MDSEITIRTLRFGLHIVKCKEDRSGSIFCIISRVESFCFVSAGVKGGSMKKKAILYLTMGPVCWHGWLWTKRKLKADKAFEKELKRYLFMTRRLCREMMEVIIFLVLIWQ